MGRKFEGLLLSVIGLSDLLIGADLNSFMHITELDLTGYYSHHSSIIPPMLLILGLLLIVIGIVWAAGITIKKKD